MDLENKNLDILSKTRIEQVQQKETEYIHIGQIIKTRGLRLYGYNHYTDTIYEITVEPKETCYLTDDLQIDFEKSYHECFIDNRFIHFEALNSTTARNRVNKYNQGKIKLDNLRKKGKGIDFFS